MVILQMDREVQTVQAPHIGVYLTPEIRQDICYHCTNNSVTHNPVITEQWVKYFGPGQPEAWECNKCHQLIHDADHALVA